MGKKRYLITVAIITLLISGCSIRLETSTRLNNAAEEYVSEEAENTTEKYIIVEALGIGSLAKKVNIYIEQGYTPLGAPFNNSENSGHLTQAMIRND